MRFPVLFAAALALSCCGSTREAAPGPTAPFDAAEAGFIRKSGSATINGQAFLRDRTGQVNVHFASGEVVRLVPATTYAQARVAQFYGAGKFVAAGAIPKVSADPEYAAYTRTTKSDAMGRFSFDKVAPGRYFVMSQLIWRPKDGFTSEGGAMYEEVTVTGTESGPIKIMLTGN